ncbi:DUF4197 domain-containing protein [Fontimonas sp. SYSU GA230001]|uniref:DUF4197 domain-containing protein n=1 Tax=Fontimonas sp. SYSU GA230001 TaxID=3142450 RepID=UPI0032B3BF5D
MTKSHTMIRMTAWVLPLALLSGCAAYDPGAAGPAPASPPPSVATLGDAQIDAALRDSLQQGVEAALAVLGRPNGFWSNAAVRIPLPAGLAKAESTLRRAGLNQALDAFHLALNSAAEQAAPQAARYFSEAIRQMTIEDVRGVLQGGDDAATQYLRRTSGPALEAQLRLKVAAATQQAGATQKYKALMADYGPILRAAGVEGTDLDAFVTAKTLDGIFYMIAAEEARIRRDPRARATELMREVFARLD